MTTPQQKMNNIITIEHLTAGYDNRAQVVDVNLCVKQCDFVGIVGPNGGGKTTLLKAMLKLIQPMEGSVRYWHNGVETENISIGYLPQYNNIDREFPILVEEVVLQGLNSQKGLFSRFTRQHHDKVAEALDRLHIADLAKRHIKALSGGQLQRVLLARAIVSEPDVLVLDEPNTYIDRQSEDMMVEMVSEMAKTRAVVMVNHNVPELERIAKNIVEVDEKVTVRPAKA